MSDPDSPNPYYSLPPPNLASGDRQGQHRKETNTHYTISEDKIADPVKGKLVSIQSRPEESEYAAPSSYYPYLAPPISHSRSESPIFLKRSLVHSHNEAGESTDDDKDDFLSTSADIRIRKKRRRIQDLEAEISNMQQAASYLKLPDGTSIRTQVFYHLQNDDSNDAGDYNNADGHSNASDDGGDDNGDGITYLVEPEWAIQDEHISLRSRSRILDPKAYVERIGNIAFVIFNVYNASSQRSAVEKAIKKNTPLPTPKPVSQNILLISADMIGAMKAYFSQYPRFRSEYPEVNVENIIQPPFVWWYHARSSDYHLHLQPEQMQLVKLVTDWIEDNYAPDYEKAKNQLRRGRVSKMSLQYLIRPGQVVVSYCDGKAQGYIAKGCPQIQKPPKITKQQLPAKFVGGRFVTEQTLKTPITEQKFKTKWTIKTKSISYAGSFHWHDSNLKLDLGAASKEMDIGNLNVVPFEYTTSEVRETLRQRGLKWWKCRGRRLVSYQGESQNRTTAVRENIGPGHHIHRRRFTDR